MAAESEWSAAFVTVIGMAFVASVALIILYNRWNRPDMDPRHAAHILAQLETFGGSRGGSVVVRSTAALQDPDVLADIRGMFHGERSGEPRARTATVDAVRELTGEVKRELGNRGPNVSKVPARAVQEAVLTLIFGAIAIVPIAAWREATETGEAGVPTVGELIAGGEVVLDTILTVMTAFPYAEPVSALALSAGILTANTIWTLWMVPPLTLAVLAAAYYYLEQRVDHDRDLSGPSIRGWSRRFVTLAVITWAVGTVLAVLAALNPLGLAGGVILAALTAAVTVALTRDGPRDRSPEETDGEDWTEFATPPEDVETSEDDADPDHLTRFRDAVTGIDTGPPLRERVRGANWTLAGLFSVLAFGIGAEATALFATLTIAAVVAAWWTRSTLIRWKQDAKLDGQDALALDIIHSVTVTAAALTLPLMVGYAIAAIGTGKVLRVASVVLAAPSPTLTAVGVLAGVSVLAAAVLFLDRFRDIRRGLARALSVSAVRSILMARAFPALFTAIIAILALGLGLSPVTAVAIALAAGIIARMGFMCYSYVTFRFRNYSGRDKSAARVVISGRQVTDADGDAVFIADVNGHRTAHRRVDPLITQIQRDGRSLLRDGEPERGSFARYYYREGVTRGKVDMDAVADELLGDIRTRFVANVRQTDADADTIMDKLRSEYPAHAVQTVVQTLKDRGRVTRRDDRFRWMGE